MKEKNNIELLATEKRLADAEEMLQVSNHFLEIANRRTEMSPLLEEFVAEIKNFTGCAAVGIRILDGEGNIPYEAYEGFSQRFYELESPLSIQSDQCMCINVIKGETDAKLPFYTEGGSFYMNGTTRFLATVSEEDKGKKTRNVCNQVGYESVALVPIRFEKRIFGLIHLADAREDMVPLEKVNALEGVAIQLSTALQRIWTEEELRKSEERFRTSVENMLDCFGIYSAIRDGSGRIVDFRIEYVNEAACANNLMTKDEQIGKRLCELLPAHRETGLFDEYCQVVETGKPLIKESLTYADVYEEQRLTRAFDIRITKLGDGFAATWRDITDRKQMEESLKALEEMYRTLTEASPDSVTITDLEGHITYVSQRTLELHGFKSAEELLGKSAFEFIAPEDREKAMMNLQKTLEEGIVKNVEYTLVRKDGTHFIGELSADVVKDGYGNPKGFLAIVRDITNRKRTEEALQRSEKEWESTFNTMSDWVALLDLESRILRTNRAGEEFSGTPMPEIVGQTCCKLVHGTDEPLPGCPLQKMLRTHQREILEIQLPGKHLWVIVTVEPVMDENGNLIGAVHIVRDITEHKRAEEELRLQSEIAMNMSEGVNLVRASDAVLVYTNPKFEEMFGYGHGELIGKHISVLNVPTDGNSPEEIVKEIMEFLNKHGSWHGEVYNIKKDGTLFWCYVSVSWFDHSEHGRVLVAVQTDITQRKQAAEVLKQYAERLRILRKIDQAIIEARSPEEIAQDVLGHIQQLVPCLGAGVVLFDFERNEATLLAVHINRETELQKGTRIPMEEMEYLIEELRQDKVGIVEHLLNFSQPPPTIQILLAEGVHSYVSAPLIVQGELIGTLNLGSEEPDAFTEEQIEIVREVANPLAIAIQQAQFREQLQRRVEELSSLNAVAFEISQSLDLDKILDTALARVFNMFAVDMAGILLVDEETQELVVKTFRGAETELAQQYARRTLKVGEGLSGRVAQSGETLVAHNIEEDARVRESAPTEAFQSMVGVPLKSQNQVFGVMSLMNHTNYPFTPQDVEVLSTVGQQIGMAIENVRLYEQVQRHAEELEEQVRNRTAELSERVVEVEQLNLAMSNMLEDLQEANRNLEETTGKLQETNDEDDDVSLDIDTAIPCGLILSELVSNSLKHAFPEGREGEIRIEFTGGHRVAAPTEDNNRSPSEEFTLIVSDNGVGFPQDLDFRSTESLGLKLVIALTDQLEGTIELDRSSGTAFKIKFRAKNVR